jgi:hypothetical protein
LPVVITQATADQSPAFEGELSKVGANRKRTKIVGNLVPKCWGTQTGMKVLLKSLREATIDSLQKKGATIYES